MNREIKFRGKRCSDGKWVYGFYVESKYSWKGHKPHKSWIVSNAISNGGFFNILGRYAVKDNTVGQFTGLYDKNGKEIYEGDIVALAFQGIAFGIVTWHDNGYFFIDTSNGEWRRFSNDFRTLGEFMNMSNEHKIKVIGNIHDSPELLK